MGRQMIEENYENEDQRQKQKEKQKVSFNIRNKQLTEDVEIEIDKNERFEDEESSMSSSSFGTHCDHTYTVFDDEGKHYNDMKALQLKNSDKIQYSYSSTKAISVINTNSNVSEC